VYVAQREKIRAEQEATIRRNFKLTPEKWEEIQQTKPRTPADVYGSQSS